MGTEKAKNNITSLLTNLLALKVEFGEVLDEHRQHVRVVCLLSELGDLLRIGFLSLLTVDDRLDRLQPFVYLNG